MALLFEYCFYAGVLLAMIALCWLVVSLFKKPRRLVPPIFMLMVAIALVAGPAVISRTMTVSLGKIERIVDGERHIMLNGWDGDSYTFLRTVPDAVVLQMANADVTDETLDVLANMPKLRELDLNDSSVTDLGLAKLAKLPSLETLRLRGTKITDEGFRQHLMESSTLKQLDLRETAVTLEIVEQWKAGGESRRAFASAIPVTSETQPQP